MRTIYNVYAGIGDYSLGDYTTERKAITVAKKELKENPDEEYVIQKWINNDGEMEIDESYNTLIIK